MPVYGITIPVIVRKGQLDAAATLANPRIVTGPQGAYLELDMTRSGSRSTYGELIGKSARGEVIFDLKGIAIYPEITRRAARVPLSAEQAAAATARVVDRLGSLQFDPLEVAGRNHDLVLLARHFDRGFAFGFLRLRGAETVRTVVDRHAAVAGGIGLRVRRDVHVGELPVELGVPDTRLVLAVQRQGRGKAGSSGNE